jgi:hypothetical protein
MLIPVPDPKLVLTGVRALRGWISTLDSRAGPEVKKFLAAHPVTVGTVNDLLERGERLIENVVAVQEAVEALAAASEKAARRRQS